MEFEPVDKFTLETRHFLKGLLCRDPASRLGAWSSVGNLPEDIINAPFFREINWKVIDKYTDNNGTSIPFDMSEAELQQEFPVEQSGNVDQVVEGWDYVSDMF